MAMPELKAKALELRLVKHLSYSQIRELVPVSKSTLSVWLSDYPLSKDRIQELRDKNELRIERYRETRRQQRAVRFAKYIDEERVKIGKIGKRDLFVIGLAIYWGEGGKTSRSHLTVSNSDPSMMQLVKLWLVQSLGVNPSKIRIRLQLYENLDINRETSYWSEQLDLPISSFTKPHIKKVRGVYVNKGIFGHGTCELTVHDTVVTERLHAKLKVLSDYFKLEV